MSAVDREGEGPILSAPEMAQVDGDATLPEHDASQTKPTSPVSLNGVEPVDEHGQSGTEPNRSENRDDVPISESEKVLSDVSIPQRPPNTINTRQQWGEVHFNERFKPSDSNQKYHDVWAAIFFLAVFVSFIVMSGLTFNAYRQTYYFQGLGIYGTNPNAFTLNTNTIILFVFILAASFILSHIYFLLVRWITKQFIWISGILHCLVGLGVAIVFFVLKYYPAAIPFLVFAVFYILSFISWIRRIPFASQILHFTMVIAHIYPSTLIVSFLGLLASLIFGVWWILSFVTAYVKYQPNTPYQINPACDAPGGHCSKAALIIVLIFYGFAGFYISEVIKNVVHATISGIYGAYYFGYNTPEGVARHAATTSFLRCMTYSFGSICFGSLCVSIIQFLKQFFTTVRSAVHQSLGNTCYQTAFCCLEWLAIWMEGIMEYFNHYAYTEMALYGKSYSASAKDTWRLIKDRGLDAIINDLLIDNVLTMGSLLVALLAALLSYLYLKYTHPEYNVEGAYYIPVAVFAFLTGLQMTNIAVVPIKSGVATLFVGIAQDPKVLHDNFPELYKVISETYPQIANAVPASQP